MKASAQACCTTCKATDECTVWSWCSDVKGKQAAELCEVALASATEADIFYDCSSGSLQTSNFELSCNLLAGCHSMHQQCWLGDNPR